MRETRTLVRQSADQQISASGHGPVETRSDIHKTVPTGACVVQGLEEAVVLDKNEVYRILEQGALRRQTAGTLMNAHSSRSHSVFMVTIHTKENSVDGEELLKTGKLNLVDLAGSECIGRSGAIEKRAREAGNINQSLLTLGRVITALVDHAPHVPYRESKLTRLLQDSLGGRTKTSIIATISPATASIEETLCTLDYVHRAKNILNRPEINQKLSKKTLLKEYTEEIEKLRKDLQACRDKNGIYIAEENYTALQGTLAQQADSIHEMEERLTTLNLELITVGELFGETKEELKGKLEELEATSALLAETKEALMETRHKLTHTRRDRDEQRHLVDTHVNTERKLHDQAVQLLQTAEVSTQDVYGLHAKLDRKNTVEEKNETVQEEFRRKFAESVDSLQQRLVDFGEQQRKSSTAVQQDLGAMVQRREGEVSTLSQSLNQVTKLVSSQLNSLDQEQSEQTASGQQWLDCLADHCTQARDDEVQRHTEFYQQTLEGVIGSIQSQVDGVKASLSQFNELLRQQMETQQHEREEFVAGLLEKLHEHQTLVSKYTEQQSEALSEHVERVRDISTTQNQLSQTLLEQLQKTLEEHQTRLSHHVHQVAVGLEETRTKNQAQGVQTASASTALVSYSNDGNKTLQATSSEHNEVARHHVNKMSQQLDALTDTENDLKQQLVEFSDTTQQRFKTYTCHIVERTVEHRDDITASLETHALKTQVLRGDCAEAIAEVDRMQTAQHSELNACVQQQQDALQGAAQSMSEWSSDMREAIHGQDTKVEVFVTQELQKDIPTGTTPQRQDFSYPRSLMHTDRHSLILADFRRDYILEEIVNTPIADLSFPEIEVDPAVDFGVETRGPASDIADSSDTLAIKDPNTSADSAISSISTVSSSTLDDKASENGDGKENRIMAPPSSARKQKARGLPKPRSRNVTPATTPAGKQTNVTMSGKRKPATPRSKSNTRLPLKMSNP
ncbi:Kinesin-like protein KIF11-A [Lamellibrachia satsuma]|nr:Kinesin-like protein KIF11-A [Lamellibrachia satsuma]